MPARALDRALVNARFNSLPCRIVLTAFECFGCVRFSIDVVQQQRKTPKGNGDDSAPIDGQTPAGKMRIANPKESSRATRRVDARHGRACLN